jgi:hypothetical protein
MRDPFNVLRSRYDRIAIPTIRLAFALSLVLHALMLFGWLPKVMLLPFEDPRQGKPSGSLAVRLAPPPSTAPAPPPASAIQAQPAPARRPRPLMAARQQPSGPPVLTTERPSSSPAAPRPAESTRAPASDDLVSLIEARRRARESAPASPPSQASPPAPPAESEQERRDRVVAANLGLNRAPSFGADRKQGGGIFQIQRLGYNDAEFFFFGWNKAISRNSQQMIEVRRGDNPSTELAVVRKMIAIIREHEHGDFVWESLRLGRDVSLSARLSDNAGLEAFLMREFFSDARSRN